MSAFVDLIEGNIRCELLVLIWLLYLWELYLSLRQRNLMQKLAEVPDQLNGVLTKDVYDKARSYALDRNYYTNVKDLYSTLTTSALIGFCAFYYFWHWAADFCVACGISSANEILISPVCMLIMNFVTTVIGLPFSVYNTFILEEKHGFNKQTAPFFIKDNIKKFAVVQAIALPLTSGIVWIIQAGGDFFFLYLWLFTVLVTLFMLILYPEVIAPLFDKYYPLPEGGLKQKIEALAASVSFPLTKIYIVEGSKRSSHSNAYMYGFHNNKRIVLFDTLVREYRKPDERDDGAAKGCDTDEVVAVLAHELGHWKHGHTFKGFLLAQVSIVSNFIVFSKLLNYQPMYTAFGFTNSQPIFIGLIIVTMFILMPLNTLMGFVTTVTSRKFEFQADQFALTLGHTETLKRALVKLHKDNLGFPIFDNLYSGWHHSHPPLLERLQALGKAD